MWKTELLSPAKINLHLDVAPPDGSGFHPLRSLFVMVSLYDEIRVEQRKDGFELECNLDIPTGDNLLYKTWQICRRKGIYSGGLKIDLKKKIPLGAGLGGGSSNAAALLSCLNGKGEREMSREGLSCLAAQLGSDVPFFLNSGPAVVHGRGEHIIPVKGRSDFGVLIVYPGIHQSTPRAFSALDHYRNEKGITHRWGLSLDEIGRVFESEHPGDWPFINSFTPVLEGIHPPLSKIAQSLLTNGADFVSLSGSGSAVAGVFTSFSSLATAKKKIGRDITATYAVNPLDIMPYGVVK